MAGVGRTRDECILCCCALRRKGSTQRGKSLTLASICYRWLSACACVRACVRVCVPGLGSCEHLPQVCCIHVPYVNGFLAGGFVLMLSNPWL